ncbi:unnamed protein product, partial [Nesidiocoris tenuis]
MFHQYLRPIDPGLYASYRSDAGYMPDIPERLMPLPGWLRPPAKFKLPPYMPDRELPTIPLLPETGHLQKKIRIRRTCLKILILERSLRMRSARIGA